jgi:hypothetical protein
LPPPSAISHNDSSDLFSSNAAVRDRCNGRGLSHSDALTSAITFPTASTKIFSQINLRG